MPFIFIVLMIATSTSPTISAKDIWIAQLHQCENLHNVVKVLDSNAKYSYGYLMFQMKTWLTYSKRFGTTKDNIGNADLQKKVAQYILDTGGERNWLTCSKIVKKKLGQYPR